MRGDKMIKRRPVMRVVHTFNLAFDESTVVIRLTLLVMV